MTVRELINKLLDFDPNLPVLILAGWDGLHEINDIKAGDGPPWNKSITVEIDCEPVGSGAGTTSAP